EDLLSRPKDTEFELVVPLRAVDAPYQSAAERLQTDDLMEVRARSLHAGVPFCFSIVSLPAAVGRRLLRVKLLRTVGARRKTTVLELLDGVLESPVVTARQDISLDTVPAEVAPLIDLRPEAPVLRIDRLYLGPNHEPVEYAINYLHPDRYSY